ncbi:SPOR domain-containing protein [Paraherbaspirillum soli]|uniref:SPOR domain-containing protein n=1 Tax=Paraherbaspirillum soli TaxID=631222 RepID=A0ABW0MAL4_9BURK
MGLFSFLRKNKQQTSSEQGAYHSRSDSRSDARFDEEAPVGRSRGKGKAGKHPNEAVDPVLPEKKRARRRLVGAVALVLAVVIVLPMILDSEQKPLADDIAIQIPSRDKPAESAASAVSSAPTPVSNANSLDQQEEIVEPASTAVAPMIPQPPKPAAATSTAVAPSAPKAVAPIDGMPKAEAKPKPEPKPKSDPKPESRPESKPNPSTADRHEDAARALAILDGRADAPAASDKKPAKFVLQVAALASQDKVNELQGKLKEAGIHSYTQKIPTQSGERIRIRVGPFSNKEEAEKVRVKLAKLGLNGSLVPG